MADPVTWAAVAAVGGLAAAGISAYSTLESSRRDDELAEELARQDVAQGTDELAAAQRRAQERKYELKILQSRQQAYAAASGAGAGSDAPSIVTIMQRTAEQGQYNIDTETYGGLIRRDRMNASARARRMTARANREGAGWSAAGTLLGGFGRFGERMATD